MAVSAWGITGFGAYIPRLRIPREVIAAAHRWMAPSLRSHSKGQRAHCNWDEDSITLAVEAARDALGSTERGTITSLILASATMPFADFQVSSIVAGALHLNESLEALDLGQGQRAATSGLIAALRQAENRTLFIAADRPRAKPASVQEISVGAGAAAFTLGTENPVAVLVASASRQAMFVGHFRSSAATYDYWWEERWVREEGYLGLVVETVRDALRKAGLSPLDVKHFILPSPIKGVAAATIKKLGIAPDAEADALDENGGFTGAAHGMLMLAQVLEIAKPDSIVVLAALGQGADALVLRTTAALARFAPRGGIVGALADSLTHDDYMRLVAHENGIELEWGMRAEKHVKTAFTEQYRSSFQLTSLVAGRCPQCGTIQFPQLPFCVSPNCHAPRSAFDSRPLYDEKAQLVTYSADWLSYHPAPPLYVGFVQFDCGARVLMEIADVGAEGLQVGMPLKLAFRIKDVDTARGYPRYFWKATPLNA